MTSYEKDYYKWTKQQAVFLSQKKFDKLDLQHLVREIEDLAGKEEKSLESHLKILLVHTLKHEFQPNEASRSWDNSIRNARLQIKFIIDDFPSLKNYLKQPEILGKCYTRARKVASEETKLPLKTFPEKCPWSLKELLK